MDMTDTRLAHAKPERRKRTKGRKSRKESARTKSIRASCVERDGYCRIGKDADDYTDCIGPSEWAHFGEFKRAKTRGQEPERRHTTAGSFMVCRGHHRDYDAVELIIIATDRERGCDGELTYARNPY